MAHVFVSYSRLDRNQLHIIERALDAAGHSVWWDLRSIQGGGDWQAAIATAIVDADVVVFVLSESSIRSEWVGRELDIARSQHKAVIPIRIDDVPAERFPEFVRRDSVNVLDASVDLTQALDKLTGDLSGVEGGGAKVPFTIAYPRLVRFVGRDDVLRRIHSLLKAPKGSGRARVAICGIAGIGKTQVCVEYVYRYRYFYPDGVVYLDAGSNLNLQLARLAPALGVGSLGSPAEERLDALARRWFSVSAASGER